MLPSETMIWQPEFTDKTLSRKTGAVHTAYIKASSEGSVYYHANYSCIDKFITDKCGFDCMGLIDKTSIIFYIINGDISSSLTEFMQENQWRAAFCPVSFLRK